MQIRNISQEIIIIAGVKIYPGITITEADMSDDFRFEDYRDEFQLRIDAGELEFVIDGNVVTSVDNIAPAFEDNTQTIMQETKADDFYYNYKTVTLNANEEVLVPFQGYLKTLNVFCIIGNIDVQIVEPLMNNINIQETNNYEIDTDYKLKNPVIKIKSNGISEVMIYLDGTFEHPNKTKEQYLKEIYSGSKFPKTEFISNNKLEFKTNFKKVIVTDYFKDIVKNKQGRIYNGTSLKTLNKFEDGAYVKFTNCLPFKTDMDFTFNIWVKLLDSVSTRQYIVYKSSLFMIYIENNKIVFYIDAVKKIIGNIEVNKWFMLTATYHNNNTYFYINSELVQQYYRRHTFGSYQGEYYGGRGSSYTLRSAEIGEVNFWNYHLSSGKVSYLYTNNNPELQFNNLLTNLAHTNTYNVGSLELDSVYNAEIIAKENSNSDLILNTYDITVANNQNIGNFFSLTKGFVKIPADGFYDFKGIFSNKLIFEINSKTILVNEETSRYYIEEGVFEFKIYSVGNFEILMNNLPLKLYQTAEGNILFNLDTRTTNTDSITFDNNVQDLRFRNSNFTKISNLPAKFFDKVFTFSLDIEVLGNYADIFSQGMFWDEYIRLYVDENYLVFKFNYQDIWVKLEKQKNRVDIVSDGSKVMLYIDGNLKGSTDFWSNNINTQPLYFGIGAQETITNWLVGDFNLSNVRFYNDLQSPTQILNRYNKEK